MSERSEHLDRWALAITEAYRVALDQRGIEVLGGSEDLDLKMRAEYRRYLARKVGRVRPSSTEDEETA